jgi:hypothetical protein
MEQHYPYFAASALNLSISSCSIPSCILRNESRYVFDTSHSNAFSTGSSTIDICPTASAQTLFYNDKISHDFLPHSWLGSTIKEAGNQSKIYELAQRKLLSTVASCHHDGRSLLLFAGGAAMDQVMICDPWKVNRRRPRHELLQQETVSTAFRFPVGRGVRLNQILTLSDPGCPHANVLTRTNDEVVLFKTKSAARSATLILLPIQKWNLAAGVVDMSVSLTAWQHASFISKDEQIFSWCPTEGIVCKSKTGETDGGASSCYRHLRIDCSLHTQLSHVVADDTLKMFDARSGLTSIQYKHLSGKLCAVKQHGVYGHISLLSDHKSLMCMDNRFTRTPFLRKFVSSPPSYMLQYVHPFADTIEGTFSVQFVEYIPGVVVVCVIFGGLFYDWVRSHATRKKSPIGDYFPFRLS